MNSCCLIEKLERKLIKMTESYLLFFLHRWKKNSENNEISFDHYFFVFFSLLSILK